MNIKRSISTVVAAGLLLLTAGCGGSSPPAGTTAPVPVPAPPSAASSAAASTATACDLLTVQEVQSVLGVATTTQASTPAKTTTSCGYLAAGSRALYVTLGRTNSAMSAAQTVAIFESDGPGAVQVSGIGEAAVYVPSATNPNARGGELVFSLQRGDQLVLVNLSTFREKVTQEQFVALARLAAQRV